MINMYDNKVYRKILEHRRTCPKWTKEFCMECFGGGLTRFLSDMEEEKRKKKCTCTINKDYGIMGAFAGCPIHSIVKVDEIFTNAKEVVDYMSKNKNKVIIYDEVGSTGNSKSKYSAKVMKYLKENVYV